VRKIPTANLGSKTVKLPLACLAILTFFANSFACIISVLCTIVTVAVGDDTFWDYRCSVAAHNEFKIFK